MATATPDKTVATAINSVLEAELEVAGAVTRAQAEAQAAIDAARETRRHILERARVRVSRVRDIAQRQLALRIVELESNGGTQAVDDAAIETAAIEAVARLARQLTTASVE
jgi:F0F1-type ATP synthase membrane subunit b/b'